MRSSFGRNTSQRQLSDWEFDQKTTLFMARKGKFLCGLLCSLCHGITATQMCVAIKFPSGNPNRPKYQADETLPNGLFNHIVNFH